jgi:hypothetical protein
MATAWNTFPVEFRGGLISNLSPLQHGMNAVGSATLLQNFEPSKEGGYKKILGYTKYISGAVAGSGLMLGVKVVNEDKVIAVRENTSNVSQYYINSSSTWTSLGSAASLGGKVRGVSFNFDGTDKIFFVDGVNSPAIFEDTTDTLSFPTGYPTDVVGAEFVDVYKNHIFVAKGANLAFSVPFDEEDFTTASGAGIINVGRDITGLVVFRDQLVVFSRDKIQRIVGSSIADFQLVPIAEDIGCIAADTIQEVGGDIMFLGPDGLRLLSATERIGDFGLNVASAPIEKEVKRAISLSQSYSSAVLRGKAQYRIFNFVTSDLPKDAKGFIGTKFSDQGSSNIQWGETRGIQAYVADGKYVSDEEVTVFANNDGFVYKMEFGSSFDGEAVEAIYQSPFMPIDDPQKRKSIYKMSLYVETSGSFDVNVNFDFDFFKIKNYNEQVQAPTINLQSSSTGVFIYGQSNTLYGTATYGSELDKLYNTPVIGAGNTFSFRIEDNSTNPSFSLDTAVFEYATYDRK